MFFIFVLLWCCKYVKWNVFDVGYDEVIFILKVSKDDKNNRNLIVVFGVFYMLYIFKVLY